MFTQRQSCYYNCRKAPLSTNRRSALKSRDIRSIFFIARSHSFVNATLDIDAAVCLSVSDTRSI